MLIAVIGSANIEARVERHSLRFQG